MPGTVVDVGGRRCLLLSETDAVVHDAGGARDLIEEALGERVEIIAIPVGRLGAEFFQLRSGLAGEVLQKAVNYGFKLAIIGDIASHVAASTAFRDLVVEVARGDAVFFVPDLDALDARLRPA
jgi:hypothetical protein